MNIDTADFLVETGTGEVLCRANGDVTAGEWVTEEIWGAMVPVFESEDVSINGIELSDDEGDTWREASRSEYLQFEKEVHDKLLQEFNDWDQDKYADVEPLEYHKY